MDIVGWALPKLVSRCSSFDDDTAMESMVSRLHIMTYYLALDRIPVYVKLFSARLDALL